MPMKQEQKLKTGTTTVGLMTKDAVILAADRKSTMGYLVSGKTVDKIYQVDDKMAVTIAGGVGDTQAIIRVLKAEINIYKMSRNNEFTIKAAATLLSNILQGNRYYPLMAMLIVGGADRDGTHIFSIDPVGGAEGENAFTSTGSGSPIAYGVLEDGYRKDMSKEEGMRLAARAINSARERDIFTGGKSIQMVAIDKNGLEFISQEKIEEMLKN